jgi:glycosyltransferase involved in cell wall biosynthesis
MRILFFIDSFPAGGKERRLLELMKGLQKQPDTEFELVIMSNDVHYKEVYDLGIKIHFVIRKTKKDFSVFSKFCRLCRDFKPDIVHCWDSMTAVYLVPVTKWLGIKFVNGMVVDSPSKQNIRNKTWLRAKLTFPFSNIIIGNSKAGLMAYGAPAKKGVCIYNGFSFNRIENLFDREQIRKELDIRTKYVIGMVASFSVFKDYKTYYIAARLLLEKRKDITFLAIGDYTDSPDSLEQAGKEYAAHFRLLGRRSGVESYISAMDICVLATYTEGISNSILEYMAMGKPVVATDGGGTKEIILESKTGFLVSPENPGELAGKIEILLNNETLRTEMGQAGKERVQNHFSIDQMINSYVYHYHKLAGTKPEL